MRQIDQLEAVPLEGGIGVNPFFSPDGNSVGFYGGRAADDNLYRVSILGGQPVTLSEDLKGILGASWGPDETIVLASLQPGPLFRLSATGGERQPVTELAEGETAHRWPEFLPGGDAVLFTVVRGGNVGSENMEIWVLDLNSNERTLLIPDGSNPHYVATGHVVYGVGGTLRAAPFDLDGLAITGEPIPVLEGVVTFPTGAAHFSVGLDGSLAYVAGGAGTPRSLVWVDREGQPTPFVAESADYMLPQLSPTDETRAAVQISGDIWICESGRACRPFTTNGGSYPVWTPDGAHVAFSSYREGDLDLYWKPADGSGGAERLLEREGGQWPTSWSPDGKLLAFTDGPGVVGEDIFLLPVGGEPEKFLATPARERTPRFSPNGRWLAYRSDQARQDRLYVRPYPGPGGEELVSLEGGEEPAWARDGGELFFRDGSRMMAVEVGDGETFSPGVPRLLFEGYEKRGGTTNYDVTRDGQRFLMIMSPEDESETGPEIHVVLNWTEELTRLVPAN